MVKISPKSKAIGNFKEIQMENMNMSESKERTPCCRSKYQRKGLLAGKIVRPVGENHVSLRFQKSG